MLIFSWYRSKKGSVFRCGIVSATKSLLNSITFDLQTTLHLTLTKISTKDVEFSGTVTIKSPFQDHPNPDDYNT